MSIIDEALSANATIASNYDPKCGNRRSRKIAIVTCADPRLSNIEEMLGLDEADVDMIRNFGTVIDDDAIRSLVLSTRLLGSREIMIINHNDCGMLRFTDSEMEERLRKETGQSPIAPARFYSFTDAEENTKEQIQKARSHPWISPDVPVRGFVYDVHTGRLSEVFPDGDTVTGRVRRREAGSCPSDQLVAAPALVLSCGPSLTSHRPSSRSMALTLRRGWDRSPRARRAAHGASGSRACRTPCAGAIRRCVG